MPLPSAADLEALAILEKRILWLAMWMIHHANHIRENRDGVKVGGHQASSASLAARGTPWGFGDVTAPDAEGWQVIPVAAEVIEARATGRSEGFLVIDDVVFGGAGRDVMLANTGGDRLIDWAGEFNAYVVPFAPFGLGTVSRQLSPALMEYLYDLSAADGADPTRASDTGASAARNGEPYGELGLVKQSDEGWGSQKIGRAHV